MQKRQASVIILRLFIAMAVMFATWLPHYGAVWLVMNESLYYSLRNSRLGWLADLAECCFAAGPVPFLVAGFIAALYLDGLLPMIKRNPHTVS